MPVDCAPICGLRFGFLFAWAVGFGGRLNLIVGLLWVVCLSALGFGVDRLVLGFDCAARVFDFWR